MSRVGQGRQSCLSWQPGQYGQVPYNAIQADTGLYVVRARTGGDVTPGKAKVGHNTGFFSYDGKEMSIATYEVLCDTGLHCFGPEHHWKHMGNGSVPAGAVVGGHTATNEPLYIAKARVHGEMCVGKICQSHGCAYMPYGGQEHRVNNYEVLCYNEY